MTHIKNCITGDFSGGPVVKSPPADEGHTGSIPGLGRFHMLWGNYACEPQLLSPCTLEALLCGRRVVSVKSPCGEPLLTATRENPFSNKGSVQPQIHTFF